MTDSEFVLSVLEDGQPHSQAELLRRSFEERGCGLTVHSRIADLRHKGHVIVCERVDGAKRGEAWRYQLLGSLVEASDQSTAREHAISAGLHAPGQGVDGGRLDVSTNEPLFTMHRSPDWA